MRLLPEQMSRPLRWGFFVATAAIVALLGLRYGGTIYLSGHSEEMTRAKEIEIRQTVRELFRSRMNQLQSVAGAVAVDRGITENVISHDAGEVADAFRELATRRPREELSLDILDARGSLLAWSGRRASIDFDEIVQPAPTKSERVERDTMNLIAPAGLHTFLCAAIRVPDKGIVVVASEPLEVQYPISNQFVQQTSITRTLFETIGQRVELLPGSKRIPSQTGSRLRIEIEDPSGYAIGAILTDAPSIEREILDFQGTIDQILKTFGCLVSVAFLIVIPFAVKKRITPWQQVFVFGIGLWVIRFGWRWVEFPASLVGGRLFDPSGYGSTFGFGLTSSAGETLFTSLTLLAMMVYAFGRILGAGSHGIAGRLNPFRVGAAVVSLLAASLLLSVAARAYGASLRSFVFDSTLQFTDPTQLVPDPPVVVMHIVIISLSVAFFLLLAVSLTTMEKWASSFLKSETTAWIVVLSSLILTMIVFRLFDRVPQVPFGFLLVVAAGGFLLLFLFRKSGGVHFFSRWPVLAVLSLGSLVASIPVLDQKLHEKDQEGLRLQVDEILRPADSWLSFVVSDGFRSASGGVLSLLAENRNPQDLLTSQIAFPLWAQTLMSKEGYSSALLVYDPSGNEISRFSVGLTTYEQTEVLKRLFDADEEVLQVVERRVPEGVIKYYGFWGTIRSEAGEVVCMAAVLLSAKEQTIFRGEALQPIRPAAGGNLDEPYRRVVVSEFEGGVLTSSTRSDFQYGESLPTAIGAELKDAKKYVHVIEMINGSEFETVYGADEGGRVVAVSLEEVGLRWHLFHLVKVIAVYAVTFGFVVLVLSTVNWKRYRATVFGFRGRLITAFVLMAAIPLLLFGYYNREFAAERMEQSVSRKLEKDLSLVHQRLMASIMDEEDFLHGITDDFCETVASELGVDFTVYRRFEVHATSRPELYRSSILDARIPGIAFAGLVLQGQRYYQHSEKIGNIEYAVGYRPLMFDGRLLGLLSVPTLYQQQDIQGELAERNAFLLGIYSILLLLTIVSGILLANQLSRPVRELTKAATEVGKGNLDVIVRANAPGEVGELVGTFNRMTEELKRNREELSRIERELAWKEMAKQVAHEIKNPLTPMKLSVQHLRQAFKDKAKDLDEVVAKVTTTVMDQIDALARIATEFSNFARMPERKFERVNVHTLLTETIHLFGNLKGIEIHSNFCDTQPTLIADADELRRVFINIMRNSVQAMDRGGTISVDTTVFEGVCRVRITDTGAGIPQALQSKVFQPNFSTKTDGTGLGLAIARKVVEDLNGTIDLSSASGKGTTIEIRLPLLAEHGER